MNSITQAIINDLFTIATHLQEIPNHQDSNQEKSQTNSIDYKQTEITNDVVINNSSLTHDFQSHKIPSIKDGKGSTREGDAYVQESND